MSWMMLFYPKEDTLKVCVNFFIRSLSGMGGQEGGDLEDIALPNATVGQKASVGQGLPNRKYLY